MKKKNIYYTFRRRRQILLRLFIPAERQDAPEIVHRRPCGLPQGMFLSGIRIDQREIGGEPTVNAALPGEVELAHGSRIDVNEAFGRDFDQDFAYLDVFAR